MLFRQYPNIPQYPRVVYGDDEPIRLRAIILRICPNQLLMGKVTRIPFRFILPKTLMKGSALCQDEMVSAIEKLRGVCLCRQTIAHCDSQRQGKLRQFHLPGKFVPVVLAWLGQSAQIPIEVETLGEWSA